MEPLQSYGQMIEVPNLKYKTTLCRAWQQGKQCHKGQHCFFAHGVQEIRTLQQVLRSPFFNDSPKLIEQNQQLLTLKHSRNFSENTHSQTHRMGNEQYPVDGSRTSNYKTVECKFYAKGQCQLGQQCSYIHEHHQKREYTNFNKNRASQRENYSQQRFNYPYRQTSVENTLPTTFPDWKISPQEIRALSWHQYSELCWANEQRKVLASPFGLVSMGSQHYHNPYSMMNLQVPDKADLYQNSWEQGNSGILASKQQVKPSTTQKGKEQTNQSSPQNENKLS